MIDFSTVDYRSILEKYAVGNIRGYGEEINFSCVFDGHKNGDRNPSCYINTKTGIYHCFGCGKKGNIISWVADVEGVTHQVAETWIKNDFAGTDKAVSLKQLIEKSAKPKRFHIGKTISEYTLENFRVDWYEAERYVNEYGKPKLVKYILDRGFTPETLNKYQFGLDHISKRITIPIRNIDGFLVGYKGRSLTKIPKYMNIGDREKLQYGFEPYKVGEHVFLLYSADEHVIVCEGELDAIKLRESGFGGAVALGGSAVTETQIKLIVQSASECVLLLDDDEAGRKAERKLVENLLKYLPVRKASLPEGKDPADCSKEELQQSITQAKHIKIHNRS